VANEGTLTVALDLNITDALRQEGLARELIRSIQNLRKESGFEITDRIVVTIPKTPENEACLSGFSQYIASQVLADEIRLGDQLAVQKK
jgi:isoleucyl-tRNA synthetase